MALRGQWELQLLDVGCNGNCHLGIAGTAVPAVAYCGGSDGCTYLMHAAVVTTVLASRAHCERGDGYTYSVQTATTASVLALRTNCRHNGSLRGQWWLHLLDAGCNCDILALRAQWRLHLLSADSNGDCCLDIAGVTVVAVSVRALCSTALRQDVTPVLQSAITTPIRNAAQSSRTFILNSVSWKRCHANIINHLTTTPKLSLTFAKPNILSLQFNITPWAQAPLRDLCLLQARAVNLQPDIA